MADSSGLEEPLLVALRQFERFSSLDPAQRTLAVASLTQLLEGNRDPPYDAAADAHRELVHLIESENSFAAGESLLKLYRSSQIAKLPSSRDAIDATLGLLQKWSESGKASDTGYVVSILNSLRIIISLGVIDDVTVLLRLAALCIEMLGSLPKTLSGEPTKLDQIARACWRVFLDACRAINSDAQLRNLVPDLISHAESSYAADQRHPTISVQRFSSTETSSVAIDVFSAIVFSLIQSRSRSSERQSYAEEFVNLLFERLIERCKEGNNRRSRALVEWVRVLVRDATSILRAPEWPVAEVFLLPLLHNLKLVPSTQTMMQLSADIFSVVALCLQKDAILSASTWIPPEKDVAVTSMDVIEMVSSCPCGESANDNLMVDCCRCRRWFHAKCYDISDMDANLQERAISFVCMDCSIVDSLEETQRAKAEAGPMTPTRSGGRNAHTPSSSNSAQRIANDPVAKKMKLIRDHLRLEYTRAKDSLFLTAFWCYATPEDENEGVLQEEYNETIRGAVYDIKRCVTRVGASRLACLVGCSDSSSERLSGLLVFTISALVHTANTSSSAKARGSAIEGLGSILSVNPALLETEQSVALAITYRMKDEKPSVREAVLQHVISKLDRKKTLTYLPSILECMNDLSPSVRKRAVELAGAHLYESSFEIAGQVLFELAQRLEDSHEPTVQASVRQTLREYLFSQNDNADRIAHTLCAMQKPERILTTLNRITSLIKAMLDDLGKSDDTSASTRKLSDYSAENVKRIVEAMVNRVTKLEPVSALSALRALKAIAKADSSLIDEHQRILIPLIAPNPKPSPEIAEAVAEIFCTTSLFRGSDPILETATRDSLADNLQSIVFRNSPSTLQSAIRALVRYERTPGLPRSGRLLRIDFIRTEFTKYIIGMQTPSAKKGPEIVQMLQRVLTSLGLIARYDRELTMAERERLYSISLTYVNHPEVSVRRRAVTAIGQSLVHVPHQQWCEKGVYSALQDENSSMRACALMTMQEMLEGALESHQTDQNAGLLETMVCSKLNIIIGEMHGYDLICRRAAFDLIRALLDRGKIHSDQVLPSIVSLMRDPALKMSAEALIDSELKKRTSETVATFLCSGVKSSKPEWVTSQDDASKEDPSCFNTVFEKLCEVLTASQRYKLLERMCDLVVDRDISLTDSIYYARVLAALPYSKQCQAQFVCQKLRNIGRLQTSNVKAELEVSLGPIIKAHGKKEPLGPEAKTVAPEKIFKEACFGLKVALTLELCVLLRRTYQIDTAQMTRAVKQTEAEERESKDAMLEGYLDFRPSFAHDQDVFDSKTVWTNELVATRLFRRLLQASNAEAQPKLDARKDDKIASLSKPRYRKDDDDEDYEDVAGEASIALPQVKATITTKPLGATGSTSSNAQNGSSSKKSRQSAGVTTSEKPGQSNARDAKKMRKALNASPSGSPVASTAQSLPSSASKRLKLDDEV